MDCTAMESIFSALGLSARESGTYLGGGEWAAHDGREMIESFDPATGAKLGEVSASTAADYATIVSVAQKLPESLLQEDEKLLMYYDVASMRVGE